MFNLSSLVFDSRAAAKFAATKSPIIVFAIHNSSNTSLFLKASHNIRNFSSEIGMLFKLAVFKELSPLLILATISSGSVRFGSEKSKNKISWNQNTWHCIANKIKNKKISWNQNITFGRKFFERSCFGNSRPTSGRIWFIRPFFWLSWMVLLLVHHGMQAKDSYIKNLTVLINCYFQDVHWFFQLMKLFNMNCHFYN